jgi:hypothetical protein
MSVHRGVWNDEQLELLRKFATGGASLLRASVALKRPMLSVRNKARELGTPFAHGRDVKRLRDAKISVAEKMCQRP